MRILDETSSRASSPTNFARQEPGRADLDDCRDARGAITYLAHICSGPRFSAGGRSSDDEEGGSPWAMLLLAILALRRHARAARRLRAREYQADASGARLAGRSSGLAKALEGSRRPTGRADAGEPRLRRRNLIPRYTRQEMGHVWSDANKFAKWLESACRH